MGCDAAADGKSLPAMPSLSLPLVERARDKITDEVLLPYYGTILAGDLFAQVVEDLRKAVCPRAAYEVVMTSLLNLAGRQLSVSLADELAWRIAGNLHRLRAGEPVPPWPTRVEREWSTVEVYRVRHGDRLVRPRSDVQELRADQRGLVKQRGILIWLKFLTGLPAGIISQRFWSPDYYEPRKQVFGFDRWNREKHTRVVSSRVSWPFLDPQEFHGMRFAALVDPEKCRDGLIAVEEIQSSSAALTRNRNLMTLRMREEYRCPLNYTTSQRECHACEAGMDICKAACRRQTLVNGDCAGCKKTGVQLDPEAGNVCLRCAAIRR